MQPQAINKIGCDKNCTKPCPRSQQQSAKQKFKKQHNHQGFKYYQKVLNDLQFVQVCRQTQVTIMRKQIMQNFSHFIEQIKQLEKTVLQLLERKFGQGSQDEMSSKINKFKKKQINRLSCRDVYQINRWIKREMPKDGAQGQGRYESEESREKRGDFQDEVKKIISEGLGKIEYEKFKEIEVDLALNQTGFFKVLKEREQGNNGNGNSQSEESVLIDMSILSELNLSSNQQSEQESRLNYESSAIVDSQESFDLNSSVEKSLEVKPYDSFQRQLKRKQNSQTQRSSDQSLHLSQITDQLKSIKPSKAFKKLKGGDHIESDYEQVKYMMAEMGDKEMMGDMGEESRILEPQAEGIEEVEEEQNQSKVWEQSRYRQYYDVDMTEQQQLQRALQLSQKQSLKQPHNSPSKLAQSSAFTYNYQQPPSSSLQQPHPPLMSIYQIHKLTQKLYVSKEKFDVKVQVFFIIKNRLQQCWM